MPPKQSSSQNQPSISSFFTKPLPQKRPAEESSSSSPNHRQRRGSSPVVDLTDSPPKAKKPRLQSPPKNINLDNQDEDMEIGELNEAGPSRTSASSPAPVIQTKLSLLGNGTSGPESRAAAIKEALNQSSSNSTIGVSRSSTLNTLTKSKQKAAAALAKYSLPPQSMPPIEAGKAFGNYTVTPMVDSSTLSQAQIQDQAVSTDEARKQKRHEEWQRRMVQPGGLVPRRRSLALDEADAAAARGIIGSGGDNGEDEQVGGIGEDADGDFEIIGEEDEAEAGSSKSKGKKGAKPTTTKGKGKKKEEVGPSGLVYTPLEKQFMAIKASNPDVLLLTEVGYKFKFHGEDAKIASKELGIACFPLRNFYSASIPVHRLHVHVKKLVAMGHKVGVVRQMETAALKAAGDNRNKPFERKLTDLYTAATYVDDSSISDSNGLMGEEIFGQQGGGRSQAFVGLMERNAGGMGTDERVEVSIVSVDCASGVVIYDVFTDGHLRSELETRLTHMNPSEILLPLLPMSKPTEKMLAHFAGYSRSSSGSRIRVERAEFAKTYERAYDDLIGCLLKKKGNGKRMKEARGGRGKSRAMEVVDLDDDDDEEQDEDVIMAGSGSEDDAVNGDKLDLGMGASSKSNGKSSQNDDSSNKHVEALTEMEKPLWPVLAAMVKYLQRFHLEEPLLRFADAAKFSAVAHMIMSSNTLNNLEIFRNQTDYTEKGSLIWLLDHTKTKMGRRVLKEWIGRPLTDSRHLQKRLDAVEELLNKSSVTLEKMKGLLKNMPDLQRGLCRIQYHKATPGEVATLLIAFQRLGNEFNDETSLPDSSLLRDIVESLPRIKQTADRLLADINIREARTEDPSNIFVDREKFPEIQEAKECISLCEAELQEHLKDLRKTFKRPKMDYITVAGIDHLIEMKPKEAVPVQWVKVSQTKHAARYHTPVVVAKSKELEQGKETLRAAAKEAFIAWQSEICDLGYDLFRDAVVKLSTFDCLYSFARVAQSSGYVKPEFVGGNELVLKGLRHPMAETTVDYVPADLSFTEGGKRVAILTGPNMSGKSTVSRAAALIVLMAQIGSFVPCSSAKLGMHDAIYTRMGAMDRLSQGQSTFMVEMIESAEILRQATDRSLVLLDELGRGTSTFDGTAVAYGVLDHLTKIGCSTLFTTHLSSLASEIESKYPDHIANQYMSFEEIEGPDGLPEIVFLYALLAGLADRSFGVWVGRLAGLPMPVLKEAQKLAEEYRQRNQRSGTQRKVDILAKAVGLSLEEESMVLKVLKRT